MSPKQNPSQSISIGNGQISNLQIGGQAGGDLNVTQSQQIAQGDSSQEMGPSEVSSLLDELKDILRGSGLSDKEKKKAIRSIETAQDEVNAEEPDREFAAKNLQRATQVLKDAASTVEAGTTLWDKVQPILKGLLPWFKVGGFFL